MNEAMGNLIPLALSNVFHVGEIISITSVGSKPGDDPLEALTGFVEAVTWSHVVVRDFRKKQVFLPHARMEQMMISNWSRRPAKLIRFIIPVQPGLSGGAAPLAALAQFARKWINEHPDVDQQGYKKSVIKLNKVGQPLLEAIFYPKRGRNKHILRSEFVVMIMDAARRFDICVQTAEIRTAAPWSDSNDRAEEDDLILQDLLPSSELTRRAGWAPKQKPE